MALLHLGEARRKEGLDGCHPRRIRHRRLNSSRRPAGEGKRVLAGKRPPRHLRLRRRIQVGTGTGRCGIATCGSGRNAGCARQTAAASGGVQECSRGGSEKGSEKAEDGGMIAPTAHCGCAAAAAAAIAALTRAAALTRRAAYSCEEARTAGAESVSAIAAEARVAIHAALRVAVCAHMSRYALCTHRHGERSTGPDRLR